MTEAFFSRDSVPNRFCEHKRDAGERRPKVALFVLFIAFVVPTLAAAEPANANRILDGPAFEQDVLPILREHCVACHREGQKEGGLSLESGNAVFVGGDSGPAVVAKAPERSPLLTRSMDDDDPMPPEDNSVGATRLNEEELAVLHSWIAEGAKLAPADQRERIDWQPIPDSFRSGFALDVSPDGQSVAVANANRIEIVDTESRTGLQKLIDSSLPQPGTVDVDLIQAIAFFTDGRMAGDRWFPHGKTLDTSANLRDGVARTWTGGRSDRDVTGPDRVRFCRSDRPVERL